MGAVLGGWTLVGTKKLGSGGNGIVWEVRGEGHQGRYAIKTLTKTNFADREGRFAAEVQFLREYAGDGVLPLIDSQLATEAVDVSWYVMPMATPLRTALGQAASPETVLDAIATYAETLARLSEKGIGHRDIKPDNLFQREGKWEIGDFGLVSFPGKDNLTEAGRKLGPANFHAPEMLQEADSADHGPADVWSLAKTLWALLAGQNFPLPGEYRPGKPYGLNTWITYPWNAELDELIVRCTRLQPESRPTMAEMAKELRATLAEPPEVRPDTDIDELRERVRALAQPHIEAEQEAELRRQQLDRAQADMAALTEEVRGHLRVMLAESFREHPGQPPIDATNLFPRQTMPAWSCLQGEMLRSPDPAARVSVEFSLFGRIEWNASEQVDMAATFRVLHRHGGLEHAVFEWGDTYSAPLGSVRLTRARDEVKAAVLAAEPECLRQIGRIMNLPADDVPAWYVTARARNGS
ncbi:protein kinase domain-containing protein [Streptomyces turgidiscabies]|uniref:protein kinase domain-containing protein n=1 Tax=Streptomyces turgidiscabies TaxID=85558 RepID=UPI0038F744D1